MKLPGYAARKLAQAFRTPVYGNSETMFTFENLKQPSKKEDREMSEWVKEYHAISHGCFS